MFAFATVLLGTKQVAIIFVHIIHTALLVHISHSGYCIERRRSFSIELSIDRGVNKDTLRSERTGQVPGCSMAEAGFFIDRTTKRSF